MCIRTKKPGYSEKTKVLLHIIVYVTTITTELYRAKKIDSIGIIVNIGKSTLLSQLVKKEVV
jgi:hypothetical protein